MLIENASDPSLRSLHGNSRPEIRHDHGLYFFGTGTIMCALAGNMYSLIGARTFAGVCFTEMYYSITHPAG